MARRRGQLDSIGIELDPRQQDSTYETAAALIRDIRSRHGDLPLVRHRDVKGSYTSCPGTYDLARLDRLARGVKPVKPGAVKQAAAKPKGAGKLTVDGRWGTSTTKALQRFLNSRVKGAALSVDGRTGPATWKALQQYLSHPVVDGLIEHQSYKPEELGNGISPNGWRYTGRRSKGSKTIRRLQKWIGVSQDGVAYEGTTAALQRKLNTHAVGM